MNEPKGRREFMQLLGLGGVVFASGLAGACTNILRKSVAQEDDFFFVQLSDSHWGFKGPPNPEAANTLRQAVAAVNALPSAPDFVVFTGDLTHTTDDEAERRKRMREFKAIVADLKTPVQHYMPGEHDASLDWGKAYQENFGPTHYSFDYKGIHFAVLDNVSDPQAAIGDTQMDWLLADLKPLRPEAIWRRRGTGQPGTAAKPSTCSSIGRTSPSSTGTSTRSITSGPARSRTMRRRRSSSRCPRPCRSRSARRCPGTRRIRGGDSGSARSP